MSEVPPMQEQPTRSALATYPSDFPPCSAADHATQQQSPDHDQSAFK